MGGIGAGGRLNRFWTLCIAKLGDMKGFGFDEYGGNMLLTPE